MELRTCKNGHVKVKRPYGWHCPKCQFVNAKARLARDIEAGKKPQPRKRWHSESVPVDLKCNKGHPRVRRPSGSLACPTCQNAWKAARRRFERLRQCEHVMEGVTFEGVLNIAGDMVCLACVVAEVDERAA